MSIWHGGIALSLAVMVGQAVSAAPKFDVVPAKPYQTRGGLGNVLAKLDAGKEVKIGYFGGSITAAGGWRPKTLAWFQKTWPNAKASEINAAIGGTGSDLGVYRYQHDVLQFKPDLVFVEFAVNDGGAAPEQIWRAMEGIVRQTWLQDPTIDLCYVYTYRVGYEKDVDAGNCWRAASADELLAAHYDIPSINVATRICELQRAGQLVYQPAKGPDGKPQPVAAGAIKFSDDGVHPLDAGHQIYCDQIAEAITAWRQGATAAPHALKEPFIADHWTAAKMVELKPSMLSAGWRKLAPTDAFAKQFGHRVPSLWEATKPGETISFKFKGTTASLYDILGPNMCQVNITVDGKARSKPVPRFDSYCSWFRLATLGLVGGADAVHEVKVEIDAKQPDRSSVTKLESQKPGYDPKKYDGTVFRVGAILLLGDLVE